MLLIVALATMTSLVATGVAAAAPTLKLGSRGKAVKVVQVRLGLPADGIYGRRTARAVKRFQAREGLRVTGRVDAATRAALLAEDSAPPSTGGTAPPDDLVTIVDAAQSALGKPYGKGAAGPDAFDCSGLVVYAAAAAGITLPRSSFEQFKLGTPVEEDAIVPGDLVFFDTNGPGASDVGIATSATEAISATTHGVREHEIFGPYWGEHFLSARRVP